MAITRQLPKRQTWLIKRMKRLGYHANINGVCYGIAHMGMQAILLDDLETFNQRLQQIYDTINVQESLREIHKRQQQLKSQGMSAYEDMFNLACLFKQGVCELQKTQRKRFATPHIPQQWIDILSFFDGVELYQSTERYPQLFDSQARPYTQSAEKTLPLVTPVTLEKQGGVAIGEKFSGIYTTTELDALFKIMHQSLSSFGSPVAFVLGSSNHAITVGYDPKKQSWIFIDANQPPALYFTDSEIGEKVKSAFANGKYTAFSMQAYGLQQYQAEFTTCLLKLTTHKIWQSIHSPNKEKINRKDDEKATWLYVAADCGLTETVYALLKHGAEQHACTDGFTPLYIAVQNGHAAVVEAFLKNKSDPNKLINGFNLLYLAANYGYVDVVKILLSYGANPNPEGNSPLKTARKMQHAEIVELLLKANKKDVDMMEIEIPATAPTPLPPCTLFRAYNLRSYTEQERLAKKIKQQDEDVRSTKRLHTAMHE